MSFVTLNLLKKERFFRICFNSSCLRIFVNLFFNLIKKLKPKIWKKNFIRAKNNIYNFKMNLKKKKEKSNRIVEPCLILYTIINDLHFVVCFESGNNTKS